MIENLIGLQELPVLSLRSLLYAGQEILFDGEEGRNHHFYAPNLVKRPETAIAIGSSVVA
jgi:hypothetical protein